MTPGEWCPLRRRAPKAPSRDEHHSDETGVKGGGASSKGGGEETATKGGGLPGGRRPSETRVMARRLRREDVRASKLTRLESPRSPGQLTISAGGTTNKRSGGQSRISKGGGHLGAGAGGQRATKTNRQLGNEKEEMVTQTKKRKKKRRRERRGDRVQGCDDPSRDWDLGLSPDPPDLAPVGEDDRICRRQRTNSARSAKHNPPRTTRSILVSA